jgi:hypothetical protein
MAWLAVISGAASLGLSGDLNGRGRCIIQLDQLWLSIDRHDLVAIDGSRLCGVVAPLERLDRVFRGRHRCAGRHPFILELESLDAAQKITLNHDAFLQLRALDSKTEQSLSFCLLSFHKIPRQCDDVRATDCTHS